MSIEGRKESFSDSIYKRVMGVGGRHSYIKNKKSKTILIEIAPHSYFKHEKLVALEAVNWLNEFL